MNFIGKMDTYYDNVLVNKFEVKYFTGIKTVDIFMA